METGFKSTSLPECHLFKICSITDSQHNYLLQVDYDPLGDVIGDSAPDFLLPFGFRCGVADTVTRLVVFVDGRSYDPSVGRWMVPDYRRLVANVDSLASEPQMTNLYRAGSVLWNQRSPSDTALVTGTYVRR